MGAILGILGVALAGVAVLLLARRHSSSPSDHGSVSENWLAEQRSSREDER
jgi:hypothetical protein